MPINLMIGSIFLIENTPFSVRYALFAPKFGVDNVVRDRQYFCIPNLDNANRASNPLTE